MRIIAVGCEYSGVSTLINGINNWGNSKNIHHHLDDHFTIPDAYHLTVEEQQGMLDMLPAIKERFQRFQIVYHIRLINRYDHILLGGFHIEESVYGPRYYYPGLNIQIREYESNFPTDTILVHLYAKPEVIRARLEANPHPHTLVPSNDIPLVLEQFQEEVSKSWIRRKFEIDTSDLTPQQLLEIFLERSVPYLNPSDGNTRLFGTL